ncbi:MAG: hypothetical protein KDD56_08575, partial [Bdellovibrionales bacterium]|nr:hypothetical protein [Bdellovibrionales bacterium]
MKIRLIDQDLKAQGNQSLKAYLADQERGAAPEKVSQALLDEFSRLMDKISAKVDAKKPEFSLDAVKTPDVVSQQAVMKLEKLKVETDNKKLVKAEVEINKDKAKLKPEAKVLTKDQKQEAKTSEDQIEAKNENHVDNKEVEVIEKEVIAKDEVETEIQEEQITEEEILDLEIENEILIAEDSTKTEEATEIEINTQDISKAASQEVNKSLEQEPKKEVSTDEIETEELSDVKAAKNLNQDNDKQQQKPKVDAEKDLVTNEKSVKKDKVTEELPVEAKTSNPQFNDQKPTAEGNIHAKVEAAVD